MIKLMLTNRTLHPQATPIAEAARGDHRNLQLVRRRRNQDQARHIIFTGMAGAFKAVDRNNIDPSAFG